MSEALVTAPQLSTPDENPLKVWEGLYAEELKAVDALMLEMSSQQAALIPQVVEYIIQSGGKRIRPVLTILSAKLCGYLDGHRHVNLAACIEFLHTATLLHDDVVDESELRRGVDTANIAFGNAASVLVGDFLLSRSFQLMARDGSIKVLGILADASAVITEGEVKQLMAANDISTTQDTYIDIIASKTSELFAAATRIGAVLAERDQAEEDALYDFGRYLGVAFQLADDALDYSAKQQQLGKTVGDDFREGKVTLPVIVAYETGDAEEKAFWERVIGDPETQQDADLEQAIAYIESHQAIEKTLDFARSYEQKAFDCLSGFADSDYKTALSDILTFSVSRAF